MYKFYFHPIYGQIEINIFSDSKINIFVLNKQEWKDDLSKICFKNEVRLNQISNQTNLWVLSTSFTSIDRMYLILTQCNSSLNLTDVTYKLILTNGKTLFTEHFSDDERGNEMINFIEINTYL